MAAYRFEALQTFYGMRHTQYLKGMRYTVREGNNELDAFVHSWAKQGKVRIVPIDPRQPVLRGTAIVS